MGSILLRLIIGMMLITQFPAASFRYKKRNQHIRPKKFPECGDVIQSPIPLSTRNSIALPLPALEMIGFHDFLAHPLTLVNNGYTGERIIHSFQTQHSQIIHIHCNCFLTLCNQVRMNVAPNAIRQQLPYVFGAMMNTNQRYELESLHFHWGLTNNRGSEHVLNDVRYPMEMHVIHRNEAYLDVERALSHADGLVVLGIFFQLQDADNKNLNPILNCLPLIRCVNTKVKMNTSITLSSLMPKNIETYYTYRGSMTTPPCSAPITWIIFSTPVPISFKQIDQFRKLSNGAHVLANNYRELQHIGPRKIYVRKLAAVSANNMDLLDSNVTNSMWFWE